MQIRFYQSSEPALAEDFLERVRTDLAMACILKSAFPVFHDPEEDEQGRPCLPVSFTIGKPPARPGMQVVPVRALAGDGWPDMFVGGHPISIEDSPRGTRIYLTEPAVEDSLRVGIRRAHLQRVLVVPFEAANAELFEYFARHPERMYELEPRRYEELIGAVFRNQGMDTELTPVSGDEGIDLRIVQHDVIGPIITLAQMKRNAMTNPVGLEVVQALSGAVQAEHAHRGIVVTTSRFLPGVQRWVERTGVAIELADNARVVDWLQRASDCLRVRDAK